MRPPFGEKLDIRRAPWTAEEDAKILAHLSSHHGADLRGCEETSYRPRWNNYTRRDHHRREKSFGIQEEELIIKLHATIGSRWTIIAQQLPGRTESEVKNCWNTKLKKKLTEMGIDPITHKPFSQVLRDYGSVGGNTRVVGNRVRSIHHNKDLRNACLSNSMSQPWQQQQLITHQFHPQPFPHLKAPMVLDSPSSSPLSSQSTHSAEPFSWTDFLVGEDGSSCHHLRVEANEEMSFSPPTDPYRNVTLTGNAIESSSSSSSSPSDNSFVETLLNKHTEIFMDFPEIWEESMIC